MRTIQVVDYDPEWGEEFLRLKEVYERALGELTADIRHVGSTSVPGCAAKPTLDIDIIVDSNENVNKAVKMLATLGYRYQGDLGILDRQAFDRADEAVPYSEGRKWVFEHNMYVCLAGSASLRNHLALRDYLLAHPEAVSEYGQLKKELAARFPHDIDSYIEGKCDFIVEILAKVGFTEKEQSQILQANKKVVAHGRDKTRP